MGKLKITGKATKEYAYDLITLQINFLAHENSVSKASKRVMNQCEKFLALLKEAGFDISKIQMNEDSVDQYYDADEDTTNVNANREIIIQLPFDMVMVNTIRSILTENNFNVDIDTDNAFTNKEAIHNELMECAIKDSQDKANFIAKQMNKEIKGIDSIEIKDNYEDELEYLFCQERERGFESKPYASKYQLSNLLKAPTTSLTETVEIVWMIE